MSVVGAQPTCDCGHDLTDHPPNPRLPFHWPCQRCDCDSYGEPNDEQTPAAATTQRAAEGE